MRWCAVRAGNGLPSALLSQRGFRPSVAYTDSQSELWKGLEARAAKEVLARFAMLRDGPKEINGLPPVEVDISSVPTSKVNTLDIKQRPKTMSWRLFRGIAPPCYPSHDVVFLGMILQLQTMLRSEISSL